MNLATTLRPHDPHRSWLYYLLFFISGFPALLYQIVWQRALFTLYGVNVESVTMIVTVFMLGLGLGSLAGGWLSTRPDVRLLLAFGTIEISVATFGVASLWIFRHVGSATAGASTAVTGLLAFAMLLVPTLLMGSTLPLMAEHFVRRTGNVGESVGTLYSVNTFGAGIACFAAALFLMRTLGETGSVRLAAALNLSVGVTALILYSRDGAVARREQPVEPVRPQETIPLWVGMILAGAVGFIALAYEIIWYRLYAFTSEGVAPCFAKLLAFYLFGIAYGSLAVRDGCRGKLGNNVRLTLATASKVVVMGAIAAFLLGPALSVWVRYLTYELSFPLVFIAAALLGASFPLLSHAAIDPARKAGQRLSFLYLSNILGSTLGSFIVGFVILDHLSTRATSLLLLGMGLLVASVLAFLAGSLGRNRIFALGCVASVALVFLSGQLYSSLYERLLFKDNYTGDKKFVDLVENRSGEIAVDSDGVVYGGGAYDGRFNVDLVHDSNGLFRAFAVAGLHPRPKDALVIGLSSGSWVQVLASNPNVDDITVVEINPGYLPLIREHAAVASLLNNPKVHIVIDDGRRWLLAHPDRKFDFILMNTTYHFRANISNLLSSEFLALVRTHLKPGGIEYYNTTGSKEAQATGAAEFPYALRIFNFIAVSDGPIRLDKDRWRVALASYQIDGHPVFDLTKTLDRDRMNEVVNFADQLDVPHGLLESRESIQNHTRGLRLITDDNMGSEWR